MHMYYVLIFIIIYLVNAADFKGKEGEQSKTDTDGKTGYPAHCPEFGSIGINFASCGISPSYQNGLQQHAGQNIFGITALVKFFQTFQW